MAFELDTTTIGVWSPTIVVVGVLCQRSSSLDVVWSTSRVSTSILMFSNMWTSYMWTPIYYPHCTFYCFIFTLFNCFLTIIYNKGICYVMLVVSKQMVCDRQTDRQVEKMTRFH